MNSLRMVLIPAWLEEAIKAAKVPLNTVLDTVKLSSIVSKDDVAFYIDVNNRLYPKMFQPVSQTVPPKELYPFGNRDGDQALRELQDYLTRRLENRQLEEPEIPPHAMLQHMPIHGVEGNGVGNNSQDYIFEVFQLDGDVLGMRVALKREDETSIGQDVRSYNAFIQQLSQYLEFETIATTPAFNEYVRLSRLAATW